MEFASTWQVDAGVQLPKGALFATKGAESRLEIREIKMTEKTFADIKKGDKVLFFCNENPGDVFEVGSIRTHAGRIIVSLKGLPGNDVKVGRLNWHARPEDTFAVPSPRGHLQRGSYTFGQQEWIADLFAHALVRHESDRATLPRRRK